MTTTSGNQTAFTLPLQNNFASLGRDFYDLSTPTPIETPYLIATNVAMTAAMGLSNEDCLSPAFCEFFSGNTRIDGSISLAAVYSGHQFGMWAGQLGDGRAILLGDVAMKNHQCDQALRYELQLKGAGMTAYSRMGDGRAVLRSSVREFLCSEAMAGLGIPTSQTLCITGADQYVMREQPEKIAIVTRMAQSFIRFGSFEHWYYQDRQDNLQTLADFVITHYYPELSDHPSPYQALLQTVVERTANLMAQWQAVGFMHGVMNTDNMSILGITLDYGPFGFMEAFNPEEICNHSDTQGRYAFHMQPRIGQWNCHALAQALLPLIGDVELTQAALAVYVPRFEARYLQLLRAKFGVSTEDMHDQALFEDFFDILHASHADYTISFRTLAKISASDAASDEPLRDLFIDLPALDAWLIRYRSRLRQENSQNEERRIKMNAVNPKYILRNYLAQQAIEAAEKKDFSEIKTLQQILAAPFDEQMEYDHYAELPPDWAASLSVSCSS